MGEYGLSYTRGVSEYLQEVLEAITQVYEARTERERQESLLVARMMIQQAKVELVLARLQTRA